MESSEVRTTNKRVRRDARENPARPKRIRRDTSSSRPRSIAYSSNEVDARDDSEHATPPIRIHAPFGAHIVRLPDGSVFVTMGQGVRHSPSFGLNITNVVRPVVASTMMNGATSVPVQAPHGDDDEPNEVDKDEPVSTKAPNETEGEPSPPGSPTSKYLCWEHINATGKWID